MIQATLVYCIKDDSVLFAMKKRGFGIGKLNGYGGKVHSGERITEAAVRELFEEAKISCEEADLEKFAELDFFFPEIPKEKDWDQTVHVFLLRKWWGKPQETDEMRPEWHNTGSVPFDKMWVDDCLWLPRVLNREKMKASFTFAGKGDSVADHKIINVEHF